MSLIFAVLGQLECMLIPVDKSLLHVANCSNVAGIGALVKWSLFFSTFLFTFNGNVYRPTVVKSISTNTDVIYFSSMV